MTRRGRMSAANASRSAMVRGSRAFEHQLPDVFDRSRLREVDGAVLAVVVEAFEAAHVADGRVGDDDTFEALRHLVGLRVGGLDHRDAHEVAHRDDPDELLSGDLAGPFVVDDGNVAVAALGEARERGAGLDAGADRVGVGGHPLGDLRGRRVGSGGGQTDHVAFGQDADRAVVVVDDDDRAHPVLAHALRGEGDGLGGLRGDDGPAHEVADGAFGSHGPILGPPPERPTTYSQGAAGAPWRPAPDANRVAPANDSPDRSTLRPCSSSTWIASASGSPHCS